MSWLPNTLGICRSIGKRRCCLQGIDIKRAVLAFWVGYAENRTNSRVNLTSPPRQFDGIR